MSRRDVPHTSVDPVRCKAHTRSGAPCKSWAVRGATVCRMHGGAAPQVKRKAAERLKDARDLILEKFVEYTISGLVDPKTALEACVKLTAIVETLEGRVSNRTEVITPDAVEAEIARLEAQFAASE